MQLAIAFLVSRCLANKRAKFELIQQSCSSRRRQAKATQNSGKLIILAGELSAPKAAAAASNQRRRRRWSFDSPASAMAHNLSHSLPIWLKHCASCATETTTTVATDKQQRAQRKSRRVIAKSIIGGAGHLLACSSWRTNFPRITTRPRGGGRSWAECESVARARGATWRNQLAGGHCCCCCPVSAAAGTRRRHVSRAATRALASETMAADWALVCFVRPERGVRRAEAARSARLTRAANSPLSLWCGDERRSP